MWLNMCEYVSVVPSCSHFLFSVHPEAQPAGPPSLSPVPLRSPYPYAAESACEEKGDIHIPADSLKSNDYDILIWPCE